MRYPASEKLEIIRTVERSHLPTKQTLDMLGIPRSTFYRWYDLYFEDGLDGLSDKSPSPKSVWNRIPDDHRDDLIEFALEHEALTSRELAVKYTDEKRYYVSESSVYRILKEADLITAPDYVVIKAAEEFKDKTTAINQMWQTDFTYFKIIGWGWYYLSTILDVVDLAFLAPDFLQQVIAATLPPQAASDVLIKRGVPGRWTEQRLLFKENPAHSNAT